MTWVELLKWALLILWICIWVAIAVNSMVNNYFEKKSFLEIGLTFSLLPALSRASSHGGT